MSSIFEKVLHIDPEYQHLEKYVHIMYRGFWTPAKYEKNIKEVDAPHFFNILGEIDQETIKRCILAVSVVEDKIKTYWSTLSLDLPQTIIGDVGGLFGQSEVTHRRSYHALAEALNVDTDSIQEYEALKGRIEYLAKYIETERIQNKAFYTGVLKNYTDREKMVKEFGFVSLEKFEL